MLTPNKYCFALLRHSFFAPLVGLLLLLSSVAQQGLAQSPNYTKSTADSNLRGSLEVDPSTLGMSFNLPMGGYGGRGATLPISLTYSSKVWRMKHYLGQPGPSYYLNQIEAKYAEKSVSGWTDSTGVPYVELTGSQQAYNGYPGDAICLSCNPISSETPYYVDRALLHLPDGSTHEMRRNDNVVDGNGIINGTGVYVTVDGSRIKFDGNTIFLPDGSRYWLTAPSGVQYIDRNGNTLTYNTTAKQWTDTLGRVINAIPLSNAVVGDTYYLLPGVGGVNQQYILRWKHLGDSGVLTTAQALRFKGRYKYTYTGQTIAPYLFSGSLSDRIVDDGTPGTEHNPIVLCEIVLPNGLSYTFKYNVWGEIEKVLLPSGGYERFEHATVPSLSDVDAPYTEGNRGVIHHWISVTGNPADEVQWNYASTGTVTSVTNPSGSRAERTLIAASSNTHFGFEDARAGRASEERTYNASNQMIRRSLVDWTQSGPLTGGNAEATRNPRPTKKVEIILDTGGNALAAVTIPTYDTDLNEIKSERYDYVSVAAATGQTGAITAFTPVTLLRTEETTYLVNDTDYSQAVRDAYRARNMLGLPTKKIVKNAAGQIVAATEYKYDEAAYPLLTYASVTGYTDPATTYRGNVTSVRNWNNNGSQTWAGWTSGTWIVTHTQYDQVGNVRKSWDGKGNLAQVDYTDAFSDSVNRSTYAYPTSTTSPIPDAAGTYGANTAFVVQTKYDYSSGKVTWVQDANGQVATTEYEPVLGSGYNSLNRLKRVVRPTGGGETQYIYQDSGVAKWVKTRTQRDASNWLESLTFLDNIGRAYLSATNEGSNVWSVTETKYDAQGRANQVSNPYRITVTTPATPEDGVASAAAAATGKVWTTSTFDALNRVLSVTTPDNAVVTSAYSGNQVTVTDQAGKQRRSESDALGRLLKVWEAPSGENYLTTYKYDALDNLVQVTQGTQNRYFLYDSLKRLVRARNPEQSVHANHNLSDPFSNTTNTQWSLAYTYDDNSNLLTKTDARNASIGQAPITTTFTYDALNRNTTVGYSGYNPYINGTASVERHYDNATLGKGKFHYNVKYNTESNGTLNYNYDQINSYDANGRPTSKTQSFLVNQGGWAWKPFTTTATYDLAGNVIAETYPSGRTVNYAYDAAGRTNSFTGNLGDSTSRNYATNLVYDAAGHVTKEQWGTTTPLYQRLNYNVRQQLFGVRVGTYNGTSYDNDPLGAYNNQGASWDRGMLIWHYGSTGATNDYSSWGTSGTNNNGNVLRAHHFEINSGVYYDDYEYDSLNRITKVTEYGKASFVQAYTLDQWGNRTINQSLTTTSADINKKLFTVDTATNRLGVPSGQGSAAMSYDDVGNLTSDTYSNPSAGGAMEYDADNHMTSAVNGSHKYRYNADGKRVKRIIAAQGEFWMVYGIGGELVAEYNASTGIPAQTSPSKEYGYRGGQMLILAEGANVKWLVQDHLGSTRMEIALGGALSDVTRHDYLPFGEELAGSMRVGNGYGGASNTKQEFTGYERDGETGLDFAQARYYASVQGRFTSVDPDGIGSAQAEPQSWNGYAYVGNRPTTLTDPSGLLWVQKTVNGVTHIAWKEGKEYEEALKDGWKDVTSLYYWWGGGYVALDFHSNRYSFHATEERARWAVGWYLNQHDPAMESQNIEAINQMMIFTGAAGIIRSAASMSVSAISGVAFSRLAQRSVASVSANFVPNTAENALLLTNYARTQAIEGVTDVLAHGTSTGLFEVNVNGGVQLVNHRVMARLMAGRGYEGGPVRLISCFSGESGAAQNLANKLGAEVIAPRVGKAFVWPNGALTAGETPAINFGFKTFTPGIK